MIVSIFEGLIPYYLNPARTVGGVSMMCLSSIITFEWYRPLGRKALPVPKNLTNAPIAMRRGQP